jgi:hypothetical protein
MVDRLLAANVLFFTPTCWKRAIILHRYLALDGFKTRIMFGARKSVEGSLAGHAWLVANEKPLFEKSDPSLYTVTYSFSG